MGVDVGEENYVGKKCQVNGIVGGDEGRKWEREERERKKTITQKANDLDE